MKNIKRIVAIILVAIMAVSFTACHPKNEVAITAKDVEFTSAYYMCALINADSEAKSKVQEELSEEEAQEEIDYYSKKIDKKDYKTWVKDTALESLKKIAAYKLLCAENKVELTDEMKNEAETYADYYWSSYGYSMYYEPNGVGQETYKRFMVDSYYAEAYFNHLYAEDGKEAISADDVKSEIHGKFIIADILEASFTSEMTDEEKTTLKTTLDGYVTALQDGSKTFEEVYHEYNGDEHQETETTTEEGEEAEEVSAPKDSHAQVLGGEGTAYEFEYYEDVKALATGEVKLITLADDAGYMLVVKQDITADDYYLESLDSVARHSLKDEEFEKLIEDYAKKIELDVNKYAVNQFKVDKIVEPDYSSMY